jgi:hypothetical protein
LEIFFLGQRHVRPYQSALGNEKAPRQTTRDFNYFEVFRVDAELARAV